MRILIFTLLFTTVFTGLYASQDKKTLKLRLQSPRGNLSDAVIYFDKDINPTYDLHEDAAMVFNNVTGVPELFSMTTDKTKVPCSINGFGTLQNAETVQLGFHVTYSGLYNLSAILVNNFDQTSILTLVDLYAGKTIDLRQNFYQVQLDSGDLVLDRFLIRVSSAAQYSFTPSNCANNGGAISTILDTTVTWDLCQLYNDDNQVLQADTNVTGQVNFTGLSAGNYHVVLSHNQYSVSQNFHLDGLFVVANIGLPAPVIHVEQYATFHAVCTNASSYSWDFGDGTLITGVANPEQVYFEPGTYYINLACSNAVGCSATAQATIIVDGTTAVNDLQNKTVSISQIERNITIDMNGVNNVNSEINVCNLLGQSVYNKRFESQREMLSLNEQMTGYYIVSVKNANQVYTKRIFIAR